MVVAADPMKYISQVEQLLVLRNVELQPTYYLGNNFSYDNNRCHISCTKYITESLKIYQAAHGVLRKYNSPMDEKIHPEMDTTPLLDISGIRHFQQIVVTLQWIVVVGRFDIQFAVCSISRFATDPRQGHLELGQRILGYLKKYPKRGYIISSRPLIIDKDLLKESPQIDFGNQYEYFTEPMDQHAPDPLITGFP